MNRMLWSYVIWENQSQRVKEVLADLEALERSGHLSTEESGLRTEYAHQFLLLAGQERKIRSDDFSQQVLNPVDDLLRGTQALKERITTSLASKRAQVDSFRETSLVPALAEAESLVAELTLADDEIPVIRLNASRSLAFTPTLSMEEAEKVLKNLQNLVADLKSRVEKRGGVIRIVSQYSTTEQLKKRFMNLRDDSAFDLIVTQEERRAFSFYLNNATQARESQNLAISNRNIQLAEELLVSLERRVRQEDQGTVVSETKEGWQQEVVEQSL